jgi:hypothetical protein
MNPECAASPLGSGTRCCPYRQQQQLYDPPSTSTVVGPRATRLYLRRSTHCHLRPSLATEAARWRHAGWTSTAATRSPHPLCGVECAGGAQAVCEFLDMQAGSAVVRRMWLCSSTRAVADTYRRGPVLRTNASLAGAPARSPLAALCVGAAGAARHGFYARSARRTSTIRLAAALQHVATPPPP